MAQRLYLLANGIAASTTLTSTENPGDVQEIPANTVIHTGGTDGDYIKIPDCSAPEYYNDHHLALSGGVNLTLWVNDESSNDLYFSTNGTFEGGVRVGPTYGKNVLLVSKNNNYVLSVTELPG